MPGILGWFGAATTEARGEGIDQMLRAVLQEPFFSLGSYFDPELGIHLGWSSLRKGEGITWNAAGSIGVLIIGEYFLPDADDVVRSPSADDIRSRVLDLYEKIGESFVERLNGTFQGILLDRHKKIALLFNDRYGFARLYYHQAKENFYFAFQAKPLLAVVAELRTLDPVGLAEQLTCGCVLQNRTLFRGVHLLPPGEVWTVRGGNRIERRRYFAPEEWESGPMEREEYCLALSEAFPRILERYVSKENVMGMSLTGGLDGRMIMAWLKPQPNQLPCYTFAGMYRDSVDVALARKVAACASQPLHVIPVGDGFIKEFPQLADKTIAVSDGAMDVTGAVEMYINRKAREIAPIRLTGNYGSEILRRNVAFRPKLPEDQVFSRDLQPALVAAGKTYERERQENSLAFIAFKQVPWHHYGRSSIERSQLAIRSPYLDNELVRLAFRAPLDKNSNQTAALRVIAEGNACMARIPTDRGLLAPGVRSKNPPLRFWREATARAEYMYDYGMPASLARFDHFLARLHLEKLFLGRHKFYHFRIWYRDQLSAYVRQILLDPISLGRPYVKRGSVERVVSEHTKGGRNHTLALNQLLSMELLHRQLID